MKCRSFANNTQIKPFTSLSHSSFLMALEKKSNTLTGGAKARVILQQCLSAKLQVQPPSDDQEAEYVDIGIYFLSLLFVFHV